MGSQSIVIANNNIKIPVTNTYTYTGSDQTVTVPTGYNTAFIECWGAGGGAKGQGGLGSIYYNGTGGGGGYTSATFSLGAVTSMTLIVGQGGISSTRTFNIAAATYGGGGAGYGGPGNWGNSSGGGRSAVRIGVTEIITAGGGGSGGAIYNSNIAKVGTGGAGGGIVGGNAYNSSAEGGSGGNTTTSTGGAAGPQNTYGTGIAGSQYTGGAGGSYSGGGGGGYYGGGGGVAFGGNTAIGGGGGGSSYVLPSGTNGITVSNPILTQGLTTTFNSQTIATGSVANNSGLPAIYQNTIGKGGLGSETTTSSNQSGQNGIIIITFSRV